ncbi:MAG: rRNA maturation RNase YbeY [Nitrospirales bacterium]
MPVLVRNRLRRAGVSPARIRRLAQRVLAAVGEPGAELSIELVGDRRMRRLNRRYRNLDAPTDVLAFPIREGGGPPSPLLGDVVISLHRAVCQASAGGHSLEQEVSSLLVHGVLHLCGYDHERNQREARRMRRKEQAVLRSLA